MGIRVAAAWALIGLAVQCVLACLADWNFETGVRVCLVHFCLWGIAGFVAGSLAEWVMEESTQNSLRYHSGRAKEIKGS